MAAVGLVGLLVACTEASLAWNGRGIPPELATLAFGCVTGLLGLLGKTEQNTQNDDR